MIALAAGVTALSACGSAATQATEADASANPNPAPPGSDEALCLAGVHLTPRTNIEVERVVVAPLARVKRWVLADDDFDIDWGTYSSSLTSAPLDEQVGVCVLTKKDGSTFDTPVGVNAPPPQESVVLIVRPNGEATAHSLGSREAMLESTPRSFEGARFD